MEAAKFFFFDFLLLHKLCMTTRVGKNNESLILLTGHNALFFLVVTDSIGTLVIYYNRCANFQIPNKTPLYFFLSFLWAKLYQSRLRIRLNHKCPKHMKPLKLLS